MEHLVLLVLHSSHHRILFHVCHQRCLRFYCNKPSARDHARSRLGRQKILSRGVSSNTNLAVATFVPRVFCERSDACICFFHFDLFTFLPASHHFCNDCSFTGSPWRVRVSGSLSQATSVSVGKALLVQAVLCFAYLLVPLQKVNFAAWISGTTLTGSPSIFISVSRSRATLASRALKGEKGLRLNKVTIRIRETEAHTTKKPRKSPLSSPQNRNKTPGTLYYTHQTRQKIQTYSLTVYLNPFPFSLHLSVPIFYVLLLYLPHPSADNC